MKNNTSRIITETIVRNAIKDIKNSPKRSTRNLVDMALHFSNGKFQQLFFQAVQTMLEKEDSVYYDLVHDIVTHTDTERLITFGMNLGYNGCTIGSRKIRNLSETEQIYIPWLVTLHIDPDSYPVNQYHYSHAVKQGEEMGIYTWQIFVPYNPAAVLSLVSEHPDSAFILFCEPDKITAEFLDDCAELNNLMLCIHYKEDTSDLFSSMRDMGLLYSAYYTYCPEDLSSIVNGDLFYSIQQEHPVFTGLMASSDCPSQTQMQVYNSIKILRDSQCLQTIPWEITRDCSLINEMISGQAYSVTVDSLGEVYLNHPECRAVDQNLFSQDLKTVFRNLIL